MCEFLEPFYEITTLIFGSSYPTSNLYFMQVWNIARLLDMNSKSHDEPVKSMSSFDEIKVRELMGRLYRHSLHGSCV